MQPKPERVEVSSAVDRRKFMAASAGTLAATGVVAGLLAPAQHATAAPAAPAAAPKGPFTLPKLPYAYNALEPSIDAKTMEIHHAKHHQAYVDKLNAALEKHPDLAKKSAEDLIRNLSAIPEEIRAALQNQGGVHVNHTFFWKIMGPGKGGEPNGKLADAINQKFGSFAKFQELFADAATKQFGSGWAWLVKGKSGLEVVKTDNQNSPLSMGAQPIIGLDVWEHAYYLKYMNKRPDYIAAWWNVVNWDQAAENFVGPRPGSIE